MHRNGKIKKTWRGLWPQPNSSRYGKKLNDCNAKNGPMRSRVGIETGGLHDVARVAGYYPFIFGSIVDAPITNGELREGH